MTNLVVIIATHLVFDIVTNMSFVIVTSPVVVSAHFHSRRSLKYEVNKKKTEV